MTTADEQERDPFDAADYYDCDEQAEELSHDSPGEAVEHCVDQLYGRGDIGKPVAEILEREDVDEITVYAWARVVISDVELAIVAYSIREDLHERHFEEKYNEDGPQWPAEAQSRFDEQLAAALRQLVDSSQVWACNRVAKRTYTRAQVIEMLGGGT